MMLGVYCRICPVALGSHLCIWKCVGFTYYLHKLLSLWCFLPTTEHIGPANQMRSKKIPAKTPAASVLPQQHPPASKQA